MFYSVEIVQQTIIAQSLTRMTIFDGNSSDKVFALEGKPEQLAAELARFVNLSTNMVRVECGTEDDKVARGGRSGALAKRDPFVWRVEGGASNRSTPIATAAPVTIEKVPAGFISEREHQAALENQRLTSELQLLTHCEHGVHWSKTCDTCDAESTPDEASNEVPKAAELREYVTLFREVITGMKGKPAQSITGRTTDPDPSAMTDEDKETWAAIVRMRDSDPEQFAGYRQSLLDLHGEG